MQKIWIIFFLVCNAGTQLASAVHLHSSEHVMVEKDRPMPACGVPAIKPAVPRCHLRDGLGIIHGEEAVPHSWPWQVSLQHSDGSHFCGGSLINRDWVVTAAHCEVSDSDHHVILGQHKLWSNNIVQTRKIQKGGVFNHGLYDDKELDHDIALIKLESPAQMEPDVSHVCLPKPGDNFPHGMKCVATGWGLTSVDPPIRPHRLQQGCEHLISFEKCKSTLNGVGLNITHRMFCAWAPGRNVCKGDSGGPLVCKHDDGPWTLVGVTSWGVGKCRTDKPSVYTNVTNLQYWIRKTMNRNP